MDVELRSRARVETTALYLLINGAAGPGKHFSIGTDEDYAILSTDDTFLLAYGYKEKVQDIVDKYSQEALLQGNHGLYMENILKRFIKAIPAMSKNYQARSTFIREAEEYAYSHPDMVIAST